ncbi:MAG: hypothetical protein RR571_05550 [Anaerorhabdus sp.]|uniref:hypothetical protein n=1 Tax=Anaerorhabdus sp. TaxID=1872524 RepID=UPI002FC70299
MELKDIYTLVSKLDSFNIYDLLDQHSIIVIYCKMKYASLIIPEKTTIFIQPDLDKKFEQYLLWHELGHYLLHCSLPRNKPCYRYE